MGSVNIIECHTSSYHEYGTVPFIEISEGRVVLEDGSDVNGIHVANVQTVDANGDINKTDKTFSSKVTLELNGADVKLSRDTIGTNIGETPVLVCEVKEDASSNEFIWLKATGTIEQENVFVTSTNTIPAESNKVTTASASDNAKAIANNVTNTGTADAPVYTAIEAGKSANDAETASALKGTGTENDPYIVYDYATMQKITDFYDLGYNYFKVADGVTTIDCTGWNPVYLNGSFDGSNVSFVNVTNNLFYIVGHQTITGTTKRVYSENLSIKNFSATFNIRNTAEYAAGSMIKNIGTTGKVSFENISLNGYIESYWNAGSFFNYGPTNCNADGNTDVYVGFSVDFKKCTSTATIVCTSGNVIGGMLGHPYTTGDNAMYLTYDNESGFKGKGYTTTSSCGLYEWGCYGYQKSGSGNTYAFINGVEAPTEHTLLSSQWKKIDECSISGNHENGFKTTAASDATYIGITLGAQLTAYDSNNNKISSLAGITFVLNLDPITVTANQEVNVLDKFSSVQIINEDGESGIVDGVLKVYTGAGTSYKAGTINLYITQYTAEEGSLISAKNITIASSPATEDTLASPLTWTLN